MAQILFIDNRDGRGLIDYTIHLMDAGQFFDHQNNRPMLFNFRLQDIQRESFVIPTRGSYVQFEDDRWESRDEGVPDGIVFTGYVSDEARPIPLGGRENGAETVWAYDISCTSEDYLLQIKELPSKTYVNRTRGFIIRDLIETMFKGSDIQPFDTTGVRDGGTERLYQTDRTKPFADLLSDFGKADGFRYRVIANKLFYEPEAEMMPFSGDPALKLTISPDDPRWRPDALTLTRIATSIVNDVTVYGEDEPRNLVLEHFVSDGYQGEHLLQYVPYGSVTKTLLQDDFTAPSLDAGLWQEADDGIGTGFGDGSYLQLFEGSFNLVGGPDTGISPTRVGADGALYPNPDDPEHPLVYLRSRKGVEMSGIIHVRDCELFFPTTLTDGIGIIGGLYTDETMAFSGIFSGWQVTVNASAQTAQILTITNGVVTGAITVDASSEFNHYILRRYFVFDNPIGSPVTRRGPLETDIVFGSDAGTSATNGCWITSTITKINFSDPQAVVMGSPQTVSVRRENSSPEFTLYAPIVNYNLHAVMNFAKIWRPQQVRLTVNGRPQIVGDFIDGGVATIVTDDNNRAKLAFYSIGQGDTVVPIQFGLTPYILWKLGDSTNYIADTGVTFSHPMEANNNITSTSGAPSATVDQAKHFDGVGLTIDQPFPPIHGPIFGQPYMAHASTGAFPVPFTIECWIRTTNSDGGIFQYGGGAWLGFAGNQNSISMAVRNGRLAVFLESPEAMISTDRVINDGVWHHIAWTHDNAAQLTKLYIDGVLDKTSSAALGTTSLQATWALGYNNTFWPSLNTTIELIFTGDLDEFGIYASVLTDADIAGLAQESQTPSTPGPPAYNPQTGVTIPPQGSIVEVTYYRADKARARLKSETSIAYERAKFGDDGLRQTTITTDQVRPVPRSSEECQFLAQAYLADRASPRYEGSYVFETLANNITELRLMPSPGDLVPVLMTLPTGELIRDNILCTGVSTRFLGKDAYEVSLTLGPRTRFDEAQRILMMGRKSSLDNPEINDTDTLIAEILNTVGYSRPNDPLDVAVTQVNPLTFTVDMNPTFTGDGGFNGTYNSSLPDGVVGYEIRRDDTGWGAANYVARVSAAQFTLNRGTRDKSYFIKPFNQQNQYSRNSALVRVISPLSNELTTGNLDGDIDSQQVRLFIPIVRNPDIGGYLIQKDNSDGPILYLGDGIIHRTIVAGAFVLIENNRITFTFPNFTAASSMTVRVVIYNVTNNFGPETIFVINRPAPVIT